eukprot:s4248_g2.t1
MHGKEKAKGGNKAGESVGFAFPGIWNVFSLRLEEVLVVIQKQYMSGVCILQMNSEVSALEHRFWFFGNDSAVEAVTKKSCLAPSASLEPLAHSATVSSVAASGVLFFRELTLPPVAFGKLSLKEAPGDWPLDQQSPSQNATRCHHWI